MAFCVFKAIPGENGGISGTIRVPATLVNGRYECPYPDRCRDRIEHLRCGYFPEHCSRLECKAACLAGGLACSAGCDKLFGANPKTKRQLILCRLGCGGFFGGCGLLCDACDKP